MKRKPKPLKGQTGTSMEVRSFYRDKQEQKAFNDETARLIKAFSHEPVPRSMRTSGYWRNLKILKRKLRYAGVPQNELENLDLSGAMKFWKTVLAGRQKLPS